MHSGLFSNYLYIADITLQNRHLLLAFVHYQLLTVPLYFKRSIIKLFLVFAAFSNCDDVFIMWKISLHAAELLASYIFQTTFQLMN